MVKIAFFEVSFLHFSVVFYEKYSNFLQVDLQSKKYSRNTVGNGTCPKTVIFTADIFAVYCDYLMVQIMHQKPNYSYPLKCVFLSQKISHLCNDLELILHFTFKKNMYYRLETVERVHN